VGCNEQSDEHLSPRLKDCAAAPPANRSDASSLFLGPGGVEGAVSGGVSEKPVVGKFNHSGRGHRNQGNRVKELCGEEAYEEVVVPGGGFSPEAEGVFAGAALRGLPDAHSALPIQFRNSIMCLTLDLRPHRSHRTRAQNCRSPLS
jgi:hypothetical protein